MNQNHVLLVEDEPSLSDALKLNLEMDGFIVSKAESGTSAIAMLSVYQYDLVLLDVMLPDIDGYEICKNYRTTNRQTPVIFLTACNEGRERVHGLQIGADDYVTKPFEYDELLLRIRKLIERITKLPHIEDDIFCFGNCQINFSTAMAVDINGKQIILSKMELDIMRQFIMSRGRALSRSEIYKCVWGYNDKNLPTSRTLDNFIMFLRNYFEKRPSSPKHIVSVRGIGYKFVA